MIERRGAVTICNENRNRLSIKDIGFTLTDAQAGRPEYRLDILNQPFTELLARARARSSLFLELI